MSMKITVEHGTDRRWRAVLDVDNSILYTSKPHPRPGCAVRDVMNWMQIQYGAPSSVTLELEWE